MTLKDDLSHFIGFFLHSPVMLLSHIMAQIVIAADVFCQLFDASSHIQIAFVTAEHPDLCMPMSQTFVVVASSVSLFFLSTAV